MHSHRVSPSSWARVSLIEEPTYTPAPCAARAPGPCDRLSHPVRLDADLVDGESGAVLWHESETGMADWRWDHLWHMDDATRAGLIQVSTDRSADALVKELEGAP